MQMLDNHISENTVKLKNGRTTHQEANLKKEIYFESGYFSQSQFVSFSEQLRLVHSLNKKNILEIGLGNGLVSDFLRKAGLNVTTLDINPNLNPDVVGSVEDLMSIFPKQKFDLVLCAEVLEHMPFEIFEDLIFNISHITREYVILTLPRAQRIICDIQFSIKVPRIPRIERGIFLSIPQSKILPEHHWELDSSKKTKLDEIVAILSKYFAVIDSGRFRFRSYHHYFVLKKTSSMK